MILPTEYAAVDWQEYQQALSNKSLGSMSAPQRTYMEHVSGDEALLSGTQNMQEDFTPHIPHFQETEDALGYESFGSIYKNHTFDRQKLEAFFHDLNTIESNFGEIVRAKGVFCIGEKWIVLEQASGDISTQPIRSFEQSKVTVIGKNLNRPAISDALNRCGKAMENS